MADGFETIGWILTVKDKATTAVDKIVKVMEDRIEKIAYSTGNVSKMFYEWGDKRGKLLKGVANATGLIAQSFGQVFNSLRLEMGQFAIEKTKLFRDKMVKTLDAIANVPGRIKKKWKELAAYMTKERTWGDLLTAGKGKITEAWSKLFGKSAQKDTEKTAKNVAKVGREFGLAAKAAGGISKVVAGIRSVGGLLLGPFGKLFELFSPIIDMISDQLSPAIETFSAIVSTAFGPFGEILEIVAQNLAEAIVPFIKPLAAFLELAAVKVGVLVQGLLKGKPEQVMGGIFAVFNKAGPIVMRLLDVLLKAGTEIGGALFKVLEEVGPALADLALKLLEAIIPLIPPLTKITVTLLEKVFVPLLLKIAQWLEDWMPEITAFIDAFAIGVGEIAEILDDFFGPKFSKYIKDFKTLFIDPITEYVQKAIDYVGKLAQVFAFEGVFEGVKKMVIDTFGVLGDAVMKVLKMVGLVKDETAAALTDEQRATQGAAATASSADLDREIQARLARGESIADLQAKRRGVKTPKMAGGGVVMRDTLVRAGEAGAEAILPLNREVLERTLVPIIPDITFPMLDKLVEVAQSIHAVLASGTVKVAPTGGAMRREPEREQERSDINLAPGMYGGGTW